MFWADHTPLSVANKTLDPASYPHQREIGRGQGPGRGLGGISPQAEGTRDCLPGAHVQGVSKKAQRLSLVPFQRAEPRRAYFVCVVWLIGWDGRDAGEGRVREIP